MAGAVTYTFNDSERIAHDYLDAQRIAPRVPLVVSVAFQLTDMGNGVDRIEHWSRVPFDEAVAGAREASVEPLDRPASARILDAVGQVLGAMGIKAPGFPGLAVEGYFRVVTPNSLDVVVWMALMV